MLSIGKLTVVGVLFLAGSVWAQGIPAPVDHSGSQKAAQEVRAAQLELTKANLALAGAVEQIRKEFQNSAEYKAAADAQKAAQDELEAVRKPVMEALKQKPEYQAAKVAKERTEAERDRLVADPSATMEQRLNAATAVMNAGNVLSRMEADALAAEPRYAEVRAKLTAASQKMADLRKEFEASVKNNAAWQSAKSAIDAAKQKEEQAKKSLAEAIQKEAKAEQERNQKIADEMYKRQMEWQNRNNNNGGNWRW